MTNQPKLDCSEMKLFKEKLSYVATRLGMLAIAIFLSGQAATFFSVGFDDADEHISYTISDLSVKTDHGTGCQYLVTLLGGVTPRMNDGAHLGCRKDS